VAGCYDPNQLNRALREAQRRAEAEVRRQLAAYNREVDRINRENQRRVDEYNRRVKQHNRKAIADQNRQVSQYNQHVTSVNAYNQNLVAQLNRQLRAATSGPRYTPRGQALADRLHSVVIPRDDREWDVFLSYARIDGSNLGGELREHLERLGVPVWFGEIAISPGKSQALQMDQGLQKARAGVALLTPAYLVGRFWTERELGALLHKETLIPVLHGVSFQEVADYSGILPDLAGFETARDSVEVIAQKIAAAVLPG
jgi:TIR domain